MSPTAWLRRLKPQPASLSSKVLWVTVLSILCIELLVLVPVMGRQRMHWIHEVMDRANIAAYALQSASPESTSELLRLAGIQRLTLIAPGGAAHSWWVRGFAPGPSFSIYPDLESLPYSSWRACVHIAGFARPETTITFASPLAPGGQMVVDVSTLPLTDRLGAYARRGISFVTVVALMSGLLVYAVLNWLLVRPMEILTTSIIHFREAPEDMRNTGLDRLAARPEDDISIAARELLTMQEELRAALWRNARLAAVGTSVAKIAHDLRNILTSALLVADRLQDVEDPVVKRATRTLIPSVERASQLVASTLDFAREGPPTVNRSLVRVRELVEEAADTLLPADESWGIENLVPETLELPLDRAHLYRILANLIRNAAEAGATRIRLSTETLNGQVRLRVADNGPGLPAKAQANLFKPFTGSVRSGGTGLGLTIARDLIRAHGGDLVLERTGPEGTVFCMDLAAHELNEPGLRV